MRFLNSKQWRAIALSLLIVTGTLGIVSMPISVGTASAADSDPEFSSIDSVSMSGSVNDIQHVGNVVYAASSGGEILAYDLNSNEKLWSTNFGSGVNSITHDDTEEQLYASVSGTGVFEIDSENGASTQVTQESGITISAESGILMLNGENTAYSYDTSTWDIRWSKSLTYLRQVGTDGEYEVVNYGQYNQDLETYSNTGELTGGPLNVGDNGQYMEVFDGKAYSSGLSPSIRITDLSSMETIDRISMENPFGDVSSNTLDADIQDGFAARVVAYDDPVGGEGSKIQVYNKDTDNSHVIASSGNRYTFNSVELTNEHVITGTGSINIYTHTLNISNSISGQVVDQDNNSVPGAQVEAYGVPNVPTNTTVEDILDNLTAAEPPNFDENLNFDDFTVEADATYPLLHTREDWGLTGWTDNVDVSVPQVVYEAGEPFVLSAWDPSAGGIGDGFNSIYNTWPGRAEPGKTITIQEIDYVGQPVGDPETFDTTADDTYFAPAPTQPGKVEVDAMPVGFYRLSVEGSPASYPIAITPDGTPESLLRMIQKDLRDGSGEFSDFAKDIQDKIQDGTLGHYTTTADENGEFTIEVNPNVKKAILQASKGDFPIDLESDTDPITQLRNQIDSKEDLQTTIYITTSPQQTIAPTSGVEIETTRISTDILENCESLGLPAEVCELEDILPELPDLPINPPEDPLKDLQKLILDLVDRLESAANSDQLNYYLDNSQFSSLPDEDDIRDLSRKELSDEISAAYAALSYDPNPPIVIPEPPDPIEPIELIEHLIELLSLIEDQGVQNAYLDNSQFDEIPDRSTVESLDRTELIEEIDAANKALLDNVVTPPEPPEPPSLDPFRDRLESLLRTVAGSDTMINAYLEESRFDSIPDREQIDAMNEEVLIQELEAARAAIQALPPLPEPPEPPEPPELPEPPDLSQLKSYLIELVDVIEEANIAEAYLDNSQFDRLPDDSDIESLDQAALYEEINAATEAIESPPEVPDAPDQPEIPELPEPPGDGFSMTIPIPNNIDQSNIAVEIEWDDGSVDVMDKRYFSVDQPILGQDVVKIENYPLSIKANGRSIADIVVRTSNEDGRDEQRIPIENPAFGGDIPQIDAVDISTTRPGPNQWVSVQLRPRADAGYQSLHSVDVYDPDGNLLNVRRNGEKARFLTEGAGTYRIRLLYDSRTGDRFSKSIAIRAGETSLSTPPTIRMERSVGGPFGLAGDGFANVLIEEPDGNNLELAGILPGDARTPSEVHLKPGAVQTSSETEVSLAVLRGDSQTQVREHMGVVVHEDKWTEDSIAYRNGNEPVTVDGTTRYGEIAQPDQNDDSRRLIQTYTDADGVVDVSVNREPDLLDNIRHWIRVNSPIDIDGILTTTIVEPIAMTATTGLTPSTGGLEATA